MNEPGKPAAPASGNVLPDSRIDTASANDNAPPQRQRERGAVRNQQGTPMTSPSKPTNSRSLVR